MSTVAPAAPQECPGCHHDFTPKPQRGSPQVYCSHRCRRKREYELNYKSLGLFVPGIMRKTKEHNREWGYT